MSEVHTAIFIWGLVFNPGCLLLSFSSFDTGHYPHSTQETCSWRSQSRLRLISTDMYKLPIQKTWVTCGVNFRASGKFCRFLNDDPLQPENGCLAIGWEGCKHGRLQHLNTCTQRFLWLGQLHQQNLHRMSI